MPSKRRRKPLPKPGRRSSGGAKNPLAAAGPGHVRVFEEGEKDYDPDPHRPSPFPNSLKDKDAKRFNESS